jgi:ABC-type antimicrobial peptide transport system permease subunit
MSSTLVRKSITDLTRRKARALFTVLTLALAVASVGIFAVPQVMQQAMDREVAANRLADMTVTMKPLELGGSDLAAFERLPNVEAVEPRTTFTTRVLVGGRREEAALIGVPNFARQRADVVAVAIGGPRAGGLLVEETNVRKGDFEGSVARIVAGDGSVRSVPISGEGRTLGGSSEWDSLTFYAPAETVASIAGVDGYTSLAFRLQDASRPAAERTVAAVREHLRATTDFTAFGDLPTIRGPGSYPGKDDFEAMASILNVVTLLALISALVLLSNTMTTLIGEQIAEIAAMKAIGARRRDIRRIYLRTAVLFGVLGSVLGVGLGIVISNLLVGFFADLFFGIDAQFGISAPIVLASLIVGLVGPPLAALPAVRRAARLPLNEALRASGSAVGGQGPLDAALRRPRWLPRSVQIGLRGVGRRKRRTVATAVQVALAVATCLALLSLGAGVSESTRGWFDDNHFDIWIQPQPGKTLDAATGQAITSVGGVARAQPWLSNAVKLGDTDAQAWGLPARPLMNTRIAEGRWYSAADVEQAAPVAVLGRTIAKSTGTVVGDQIRLATANGPANFRVIGISANQADNGGVIYVPVSALQAVLGLEGAFNNYFITTTTKDHALTDRTTTRLEDALAARGDQATTFVNYDARQTQVDANASITMSITVLGLLIVAISMVALINAITMGVLERTREIGVLRSIGARARDVRRIFATEGLVVAVLGWALGIPLGYAMARAIGWLAGNAVGLDIAFVFPATYVAITLAGTVILALVVMLAPVRRAVRFKPGEALRYA